ncbi:MAG: hypothetical protein JWO82_745 [Akkermansiaceae bacterium]|nr:hypothetical protein [Akkermansiaceae bacterium]
MLVIKRILSVILAVFATFLLIAPVKCLLEAMGHFLSGRHESGLSSSIAGVVLLLICLVIYQVARSIWKDRSQDIRMAMPPVAPMMNPFGETPPPLPPSRLPVSSGQGAHSFAPGDR